MVLETQMTLCVTEPDFFKKNFLCPKHAKIGQNWAKKIAFDFI